MRWASQKPEVLSLVQNWAEDLGSNVFTKADARRMD